MLKGEEEFLYKAAYNSELLFKKLLNFNLKI